MRDLKLRRNAHSPRYIGCSRMARIARRFQPPARCGSVRRCRGIAVRRRARPDLAGVEFGDEDLHVPGTLRILLDEALDYAAASTTGWPLASSTSALR